MIEPPWLIALDESKGFIEPLQYVGGRYIGPAILDNHRDPADDVFAIAVVSFGFGVDES